jgi:hypothetical protein
MAQFGIQAYKFNNVFYGGAKGQQYEDGTAFLSDGDTGQVHETLHAIMQRKPMADFTTRAGKTIIAALNDSTDVIAKKFDGANGLKLYGAKGDTQLPGYAGASVHVSRSCLNGVLFLAGIRWSLGDAAEFALRAMMRGVAGTGATNPVVENLADALPTQVVSAEAFVLTSLIGNGNAAKGVRSFGLSIDPKLQHEHDTGLPYPIDVIGAGVNGPAEIRMEFECTDLGTQFDGTGAVSAVFTSLAQGGTLGANTITITLANPLSVKDSEGGEHTSPFTRKMTVRPRWDGITKPLTVALA